MDIPLAYGTYGETRAGLRDPRHWVSEYVAGGAHDVVGDGDGNGTVICSLEVPEHVALIINQITITVQAPPLSIRIYESDADHWTAQSILIATIDIPAGAIDTTIVLRGDNMPVAIVNNQSRRNGFSRYLVIDMPPTRGGVPNNVATAYASAAYSGAMWDDREIA